MSNINSDATGVDINCGASNVEQPPTPFQAGHAKIKFTASSRFMKYTQKPGFFTVLASLLILFKKPGFSRYTADSTLIKYTRQAIAVGKRHCRVLYLCYVLTYLKNAVGKPVAKPQEN